jgi:hypothetical protein
MVERRTPEKQGDNAIFLRELVNRTACRVAPYRDRDGNCAVGSREDAPEQLYGPLLYGFCRQISAPTPTYIKHYLYSCTCCSVLGSGWGVLVLPRGAHMYS